MIRFFSALIFAALLSACGGPDTSNTSANEAVAVEENKPLPLVSLGKAGSESGFEVTVKSVQQRSQIGMEGIGPATEPGETFVVVQYTVKNLGAKPVDSADLPSAELIDANEQAYAEDTQASALQAALSDGMSGTGDLNPNVTARQTAVWKLEKKSFDPATWRLKVSFDTGFSATLDKAARWPLNPQATPPLMFALK